MISILISSAILTFLLKWLWRTSGGSLHACITLLCKPVRILLPPAARFAGRNARAVARRAMPGRKPSSAKHTNWLLDKYQKEHDAECERKIRRAESRGNPRNYYVYEHRDADDQVRYIGHGRGKRAWSLFRKNKVHKDLLETGKLQVHITQDGLTAREAVREEGRMINEAFTNPAHKLFNKLRGSIA